jgi:hypothetical protein
MGRWLEAVRRDEKNTKTPLGGTDKIDETIRDGVLSVLSVRQLSVSENFSSEGETAPGGSVSFVSSVSEGFREKKSEPSAVEIRREVALSPVAPLAHNPGRLQAEADWRNEKAAREHSTDRWCTCGQLASYAWPDGRRREIWRCLDCGPVKGEA